MRHQTSVVPAEPTTVDGGAPDDGCIVSASFIDTIVAPKYPSPRHSTMMPNGRKSLSYSARSVNAAPSIVSTIDLRKPLMMLSRVYFIGASCTPATNCLPA